MIETRAGFGPARNVHEWPLGLARRGPRTGEVAKTVSCMVNLREPVPFRDMKSANSGACRRQGT